MFLVKIGGTGVLSTFASHDLGRFAALDSSTNADVWICLIGWGWGDSPASVVVGRVNSHHLVVGSTPTNSAKFACVNLHMKERYG